MSELTADNKLKCLISMVNQTNMVALDKTLSAIGEKSPLLSVEKTLMILGCVNRALDGVKDCLFMRLSA
jgi:hypothetical protein